MANLAPRGRLPWARTSLRGVSAAHAGGAAAQAMGWSPADPRGSRARLRGARIRHRKDTGAVGQQTRRMFGRRRPLGMVASSVLAVGVAAAVAGCSAGQITQTDAHLAAVNGDQGSVGPLRISDAKLAFPEDDARHWSAGSDVPLSMSIANNGSNGDRLESITSPVSDDISIEGDKVVAARKALTVGGREAVSLGEEDAETGAGELGNATVVLRSIKQDLFPGQIVTMTVTFRDAGQVEMRVPIAAPTYARTAEAPAEEAPH